MSITLLWTLLNQGNLMILKIVFTLIASYGYVTIYETTISWLSIFKTCMYYSHPSYILYNINNKVINK